MSRSRRAVVEELHTLAAYLDQSHNDILLERMGHLIREFGEYNQRRAQYDHPERASDMQLQYVRWAVRHQEFREREKKAVRASASIPQEAPVTFKGDNAKAFWAHFSASILANPLLNDRQKMTHLMSRVRDHREASALIAGHDPSGAELAKCVEAFRSHYLDDSLLKAEALERALALHTLRDWDDSTAIAKFANQVRIIRTMLKDEGKEHYTEVARELLNKVPSEIRTDVHKMISKGRRAVLPGLNESNDNASQISKTSSEIRKEAPVLDYLLDRLEAAREEASVRRYYQKEGPTERRGPKREMPYRPTHPNKRPTNTNILMNLGQRCIFCRAEHPTNTCQAGTPFERKRTLRQKGVCFRCAEHEFTPGKPCPNARPCKKCGGSHHQVICTYRSPKEASVHNIEIRQKGEQSEATPSSSETHRVYLSTIPALLMSKERVVRVKVLLDSGAETSLVTLEAVKKSDSDVCTAETLTLLGVTDGMRQTDQVANLTLASTDLSFQIDMKAYVTPRITSTRLRAPTEELRMQAKERGVHLPTGSTDDRVVDLLIGQDWLFAFLTCRIVPLGPFIGALKSPLGWYIAGREGGAVARGSATQLACQQLCQDLARIYEYVEPEEMRLIQDSTPQTRIIYNPRTSTYAVSLPKRSLDRLGDNQRNAYAQVMALRRKLKANGQYEAYDRAIKEYQEKGYAEVAPVAEAEGKSYFIPHHAVFKKDAAKTKIRIVFNASSAVPGQDSLNRCLSKGESINADIWSVTIRFRLAPIILVTDLVKAFSQIQIVPEDRDLLRYLWFEKPEDTSPTVYRMTSVIFGATSSPYLLGAVLRDHTRRFEDQFPEVAAQMDKAIYMDDGFFVATGIEHARMIMDQANAFFAKASFDLHPWLSNEPAVETLRHTMGDNEAVHKSLGQNWLPKADTLQIKPIDHGDLGRPIKRRRALSLVAQFYDPLSLFAPIKTRLRLFIRDLAVSKASWDDELSATEKKRLDQILEEMKQISEMTVPRTLKAVGPVEIHAFGDASPQAYGAAVYLVDSSTGSRLLLCAKLKLAPKKFLSRAKVEHLRVVPATTVPRLELMAAVLAAQVATSVLEQMPATTPMALYSDSDITVKRIQGDVNQQEPFEMRRLQAILMMTDVAQWHHVPSEQNPADFLTKDRPTKAWLQKDLWWKGPDALVFPLRPARPRTVRECLAAQVARLTPEEADICQSGYDEALRKMEKIVRQEKEDGVTLDSLNKGKVRTMTEASYGVLRLWSLVQTELFALEIGRIKAGQPVPERSRLRLLSPFLDEWGVLRSQRPAQPQTVDWETRNPMILARHPLVQQLVRREHERMGHAGEATTRSHLAQHYHLVRGRQLIKGVIRPCRQCNIQRGRPFSPPETALPPFRTDFQARPFSYVGLDHFGPLKIKGSSKVYGLMMTCAVTRAVHIEVVTSLNGRHCLNALERFFARRGVPKQIHSDNARTFMASNRTLARLAELVEEAGTNREIAKYRIQWIFQTPRAPWFGAFFERMIGVSKRVLEQTNLNQTGNLDDIRTIVAQVEAIVNSRPLIEADEEGGVALTPAHFLIGTSLLALPPFPSTADSPEPNQLLAHYRNLCESRTLLQTRLQKEYLVALRKHHRISNPTREPIVGEWVLVSGEDSLGRDRFGWPIEQIREIIRDPDGHVRRVRISWRGSTLERPVRSLIPLEGVHGPLTDETGQDTPTAPGPGNVAESAATKPIRPLRRSRRLAGAGAGKK